MLKTQYEFLFVGRDEGSFVENYAYDLGEGGEGSGKIFINMEIAQNSIDAEKIGEIIFDRMRKVFFADSEVDPYERFEESLKEVNRALNEYRGDRENDWLGKLNVLIAAVIGNQLFLTQSGEAEAYLIRKRFTTTISDDLDESDGKDFFTNIASGDLEPGDFVLLSTTRLLRYVSKNDLSKQVNGNLQGAVQGIKDFLQGEVMSRVGLILIQGNSAAEKRAPATEMALPEAEEKPVLHQREEFYTEKEAVEEPEKMSAGSASLDKLKSVFDKGVSTFRSKFDQLSRGEFGNARKGSENGSKWSFSNWGKDQILVAVVILILLLTMGVWWLRSKSDEDQRIKGLADNLVQIREEIDSAITTGQFDKVRAGDMLNDAEQKAIVVLNSGYHKDKARELLDLILETRDKLDGVLHPKTELMADLTQKRANVSALGLLYLKDKLFAFEYNALYPILLDKVSDPLTIDDNEKVISGTNYDDKGSLLFYTDSGKVIEYKDDRISFLQTTDGAFKKGKVLEAYNNRIFILDPESSKIWRYTRRRDQFDAAQDYAVNVDLKNAVDMAIDGSIYILNSDGTISKLFQGTKQDFPIKKQPVKALHAPTKIYTENGMSQIYVLEPGERRVLVFNKDDRSGGAVYDKQYILDELKDVMDFYVDKDTNTMYILTKTGVYRVIL
jgi:hypothetical protein